MRNRIEILKKKKCMSYGDIAKESGIAVSYVYNLAKSRQNNPSLNTMRRISTALGERVEKVFDLNAGEEDKRDVRVI